MSKSITSQSNVRLAVAGIALGLAPPAFAAPALPATLAVYPIATLAQISIACPFDTSSTTLSASSYSQTSKTAAILGGQMSALERIKAQQAEANPATTWTTAAALSANRMDPPAIGPRIAKSDCTTQTQSFSASVRNAPTAGFSKTDFLGSSRVRIGKTGFDSDWQRVGTEAVPAKTRAAIGARAPGSLATVKRVNRWVNSKIRYVEDRELFGRNDYWAGAAVTMALRSGDCEDIALTKMQILAAMGFERDDMFLTIARDNVRRADHALLVVRMDGRFIVLDNATDKILDGAYSHDYTPVLSFSTGGTWIHGYRLASAR